MEKLETMLKIIKGKFPLQSDRIEELYQENGDFWLLCSDYYSSIQQLKNFQALFSEGNQSVADYENVIGELEKELRDFILTRQ